MNSAIQSTPAPCTSFEDALQRHQHLASREPDDLWPECRSVLLHHGAATERVALFYHGYCSCPQQFRVLGEALHAQGWNVLIPRFAYHGHTDRDATRTRLLTPESLVETASQAVDIAVGLGRRLTVCGLSMGGLMAGWAAQMRPEVEHAVLVAPAYNVGPVPRAFARPARAVARLMPAMNRPWVPGADPEEGPRHTYPDYNTHGVAALMGVGQALMAPARRRPPAAQRVTFILNENDHSVDNSAAEQVMASWHQLGARHLQSYTFPPALGLPHNTIEPEAGSFDPALTHPMLLHLLATGEIVPPKETRHA